MAQGIRPFRDLGAVKRWPLCTAPRSQGVWGGTNIAFLKSPVNSNIVSEIIIIQQQKKLFCFASCSGYSHHQKLFRSHESGLSHNNLVSLRAFGQNHRRRRIYSLFSGTDEAATESLVNKRKFNSNTHMKSVNVFFFFQDILTPLFSSVSWELSESINFCYSSWFCGCNLRESRHEEEDDDDGV